MYKRQVRGDLVLEEADDVVEAVELRRGGGEEEGAAPAGAAALGEAAERGAVPDDALAVGRHVDALALAAQTAVGAHLGLVGAEAVDLGAVVAALGLERDLDHDVAVPGVEDAAAGVPVLGPADEIAEHDDSFRHPRDSGLRRWRRGVNRRHGPCVRGRGG